MAHIETITFLNNIKFNVNIIENKEEQNHKKMSSVKIYQNKKY